MGILRDSDVDYPVSAVYSIIRTSFLLTRKRAHQLGIDLIFLPVGLPDLNPIEQIWKQLKWEASPLIVENAAEFRALVEDLFEQLTSRLSFARSWIDKFLDNRLQFLS